jgi:thiol-disulfide isomerase/thioredoxin
MSAYVVRVVIKPVLLFVCFAVGLVYSACEPSVKSNQSEPASRAAQIGDNASVPAVEPINEGSLKKVLRKHKGEVVVINFWATWCDPCREEFPELVKLYANYRGKGMQLLLLSMDEQEQIDGVKKFLGANRVDFLSYIRSGGNFENLVNAIDPEWIGVIPATFVFNREGKRVQTMLGRQDYTAFEKAVRPLL